MGATLCHTSVANALGSVAATPVDWEGFNTMNSDRMRHPTERSFPAAATPLSGARQQRAMAAARSMLAVAASSETRAANPRAALDSWLPAHRKPSTRAVWGHIPCHGRRRSVHGRTSDRQTSDAAAAFRASRRSHLQSTTTNRTIMPRSNYSKRCYVDGPRGFPHAVAKGSSDDHTYNGSRASVIRLYFEVYYV